MVATAHYPYRKFAMLGLEAEFDRQLTVSLFAPASHGNDPG
jgi:hypothetical protein